MSFLFDKNLLRRLCVAFCLAFFCNISATPANAADTEVISLRAVEASLAKIVLDWNPPVAEAGSVTDYVVSLRYAGIQKTLVFDDGVHSESGITISDFPLGTALKFSVTAMFGKTKGAATKIRVDAQMPPSATGLTKPVVRQMRYIREHFSDKTADKWGYIPKNNCANFASQTLAARGLKQSNLWHNQLGSTWNISRTWVSSTALSGYLRSLKGSKQLSYSQRELVKVGDLAFFDWDSSGDRDHSAIVTAVVRSEAETKIFYASHTAHGRFQSVVLATSVLHPGGKVYFVHPGRN